MVTGGQFAIRDVISTAHWYRAVSRSPTTALELRKFHDSNTYPMESTEYSVPFGC